MKSTVALIFAFIFVPIGILSAQNDSVADTQKKMLVLQTEKAKSLQNNIIKLNASALFVKNFTFQYERIISKFLSATIAVRFMPNGALPFKNYIYNQLSDDPQTQETINNLKVNNFAITPEVRFYIGKKGFGRGFYIAPAYRFAKFNITNIEYNYNNSENQDNTVLMSGQLTANYGGFVMGAQWLFGKHFTLDWWIFGPLFGVENSSFSGSSNSILTLEDKTDIIKNVNDFNLPRTDIEVSFPDEYSVSIQMHGPVYGVASGLAVGFRF